MWAFSYAEDALDHVWWLDAMDDARVCLLDAMDGARDERLLGEMEALSAIVRDLDARCCSVFFVGGVSMVSVGNRR